MPSAEPPAHSRALDALAVLLIIGLAAALHWPVMNLGFMIDDYAQIAMLEGNYPSARHPLDLFRFSKGTAEDNNLLMDTGFYPWWSHPEVRLSMFRPLASALIALDLKLFSHDALPYHLHSMAWWIGLLLVSYILLKRLLPRPIALLALAFLALDQPNTIGLGWIANRNALVSSLLSICALNLYIRYREQGSLRSAIGCALCYLLALASGEYALASLGYFFAYEWLAASDPGLNRLRRLGLVLVPATVFFVGRYLAGSGARYSGVYIDPVRSPLRFATALWQRFPTLVTDGLLSIRCDYWNGGAPWISPLIDQGLLSPDYRFDIDAQRRIHEWVGRVGIVLFIALVLFIARRARTTRSGHAVWLAAGALISMMPLVGSLPTGRMLIVPGLGVSVLLATTTVQLLSGIRHSGWLRYALRASAALGIVCVHTVMAAAQNRAEGKLFTSLAHSNRTAALTAAIPSENISNRRVFLLAAADFSPMIYTRQIRTLHGLPIPKSMRVLSGNGHPFYLIREDERTLTLRYPPRLAMLAGPGERMFRPLSAPFSYHEKIELPEVTVEILEVAGPRPRAIRFTFDRPLEAPDFTFLIATGDGMVPYKLPEIGESAAVPPPLPPFNLRPE